jgi:hypothetical protein
MAGPNANRALRAVLLGAALFSAGLASSDPQMPYSPTAGRDFPTRVYWGDTHLHTSLSTDAAARGARLGLDAAYRFARGAQVISSTGLPVRLNRPLDFLVAADHSDGMGFFKLLAEGDPRIMEFEVGRRWHEMLKKGQGVEVAKELISAFAQGTMPWKSNDLALMTPVWQQVVDAAERHNDPGQFTAFIGYEWTSLVKGNNLHRVVIYRDGAARTRAVMPYTLADSADPEDLWNYLAEYEKLSGGSVLAIPHNGNLSNGMMFADTTMSGAAFNKDYLRRRQRWEPLYEASQIKGYSETHPLLSPDDEFADYEIWDKGNLDLSQAKTPQMLPYEYAREALKRGLGYQLEYGINPFEFGLIASTDSHTSLSAVAEDNYFSKHAGVEPKPERFSLAYKSTPVATYFGWENVASGYAAVWARDNTRESLWDAMRRRETYGTTGSRMTVRFFGGWNFSASDARSQLLADTGYAKGVPMGATLTTPSAGAAPSFLVAAQRDAVGANLDRIQIIKGWADSDGQSHEKIYNVAWGGERSLDAAGKLPAVGSTVDIDSATWTNTIGAPDLTAVWKDPDFEPGLPAFYYVRVIEIPRPRWTAYDAARFGVEMPEEVPMTTQERAFTSPIWYTPE